MGRISMCKSRCKKGRCSVSRIERGCSMDYRCYDKNPNEIITDKSALELQPRELDIFDNCYITNRNPHVYSKAKSVISFNEDRGGKWATTAIDLDSFVSKLGEATFNVKTLEKMDNDYRIDADNRFHLSVYPYPLEPVAGGGILAACIKRATDANAKQEHLKGLVLLYHGVLGFYLSHLNLVFDSLAILKEISSIFSSFSVVKAEVITKVTERKFDAQLGEQGTLILRGKQMTSFAEISPTFNNLIFGEGCFEEIPQAAKETWNQILGGGRQVPAPSSSLASSSLPNRDPLPNHQRAIQRASREDILGMIGEIRF